MHQKLHVPVFLNICPKEEVLKKIQVQPFSCLLMPSLVFTSKKNKKSHKYIIPILFCHGPLIFYFIGAPLFLSHRKTRWIMSTDYVSLLRTSNFMITLTIFPWCKPKRSHDENNIQSQILQGLWTTSWSMV